MKIKFLSDYVGRETAMKEYKDREVVDLPEAQAIALIVLGIAEQVVEIKQAPALPKGKAKK